MKALEIFGYVLFALFASGIVYVIMRLIVSYYNNFIHEQHGNKQHLNTRI